MGLNDLFFRAKLNVSSKIGLSENKNYFNGFDLVVIEVCSHITASS